jgi:NitT/TauT family transport system substrate-binding protein
MLGSSTRRAWLIAAGSAAAAVAANAARAGAQNAPIPITVALAPTVDATAFYYAQHQGAFEKAGLAVTMKVVTTGNLGIIAVVGGDANIGFANCLSLSQAHLRGVPLRLIAGAGLYDTNAPIARIFVAADSPIKSAKDLEDHTVAVSGLHDLLALSVRAWLAQQGVDSTKIRFAELPPPTMLAALQSKRVDAISTFEPFSSDVAASGQARTLAYPYDAIAKQFDVTAWFAHESWLSAHRDAAQRFATVIRTSAEYADAHLPEMVPVVASGTGMPVEVVTKALKAKVAPTVVAAQLQPLIDVAARLGELSSAFPARDIIWNGQ